MHNNDRLHNSKQIIIEMKLLAACTDESFSMFSLCSQFMTETQLENLRLIYLHFPSSLLVLFFVRKYFFFVSSIRNQSKLQNLLRVNSLNNLHRVAVLTLFGDDFFSGLRHEFDRINGSLASESCWHMQATRRPREGKRNYLFKQREKCLNCWTIKANFMGNLAGRIKAIGTVFGWRIGERIATRQGEIE